MSTGYSMETDSEPDINDPRLQQEEDLSKETSDVIPKSSRVPLVVKKTKVRVQLENGREPEGDDNKWKAMWLSVDFAIGADGIDAEGKLAGRHVFQDLCIKVNKEDFPKLAESSYYSRAPYTQFLRAMNYSLNPAPVINSEFREELMEKELVADITVREIQEKVGDKYQGTGDFRNEVKNFRASVE